MERKEEALSCFGKGFNCCQSVLWAYASDFGLSSEAALKLAGAFGGGIAGSGETCGAVTGGLMVIGLKHGMTDPHDRQAKERSREQGRRFMEGFTALFGSTKCRDLLGCEPGTKEGMERALALGLFKTLCPEFVGRAVELLEEMA